MFIDRTYGRMVVIFTFVQALASYDKLDRVWRWQ